MHRLLAGFGYIQTANVSQLLRVILWKFLIWRTAILIGDLCRSSSTTSGSVNNNEALFEITRQTSHWLDYMAANPVKSKHEQSPKDLDGLSFEDVLNNAFVLFRMICKQYGTLDHSSLYYFHIQIEKSIHSLSNYLLIDSDHNFTGLVSQVNALSSAVRHHTGYFMDKIWISRLPSKEVRIPIMNDAIERLYKFASTFDKLRMFRRSMYRRMEISFANSFQYLFRYCSSFRKDSYLSILI